jgi:hypothetical protein
MVRIEVSYLPKISFGIIVLNGEPFVRYNLRSLYRFAHEIIIVEGAVRTATDIATNEGHSLDGTLEALYQFRAEEDHENKIQIVTRDGFWKEKKEMSLAYAQRASGDYLWQVDIDEFYKTKDVQTVIEMLANDPEISAISFKTLTFWGGFNYLCDGWYLRRGAEIFHRIFRWGPGYRYVSHRPPQVHNPSGMDMRCKKWITGKQMVKKGIFIYHYALVFPKQVSDKCYYYKNAQWAKREQMMDWADESYFSIKKPFRMHNIYDYPSWLKQFKGDHPQQIIRLQNDILNGRIEIKTRNNDDIEIIINSAKYKIFRSYLKLIEKPDRLKQKVRSIISDMVSCLTEQFKKLINSFNV